jgi:glycosyltransferase involved in cell wall biosynthesis
MKILHVIPSLSAADGGPSAMLRTLAGGLNRAGIEVHVASTGDSTEDQPVLRDGVTWCTFRRQTSFYKISWPLSRWLAQNVNQYALVHIHALFSFAPAAAAYWAHKRGIPYVVRPLGVLNLWGMANRRPLVKALSFRLLERRIVENAAWVHFTSRQEMEEAAALGVAMRSKVIPNPLPAAELAARGRFRASHPDLAERRIILFLSRFDRKKGMDLLLPAFAQIRNEFPDSVLVLAGSGDSALVDSLRARIRQLGIERDVFWPGFLDAEQKHEALADADLFVLPSYSENFGIAAAEALAAGCPVIVSNQVAIHSDITAADAGIVVPCNTAAIATAMRQVLTDPGGRAAMAARGRALAESRYSLASVTNELLAAYSEMTEALQYA